MSLGLLIIIQARAPKTGRAEGGRPMAGPHKLWTRDGAGVSFFLIDLGTLQAPPAGDSSALTGPAARDC